jgi:stress responsive alpha/beta barrel protein
MFRHVVLFTWTRDATQEQKDALASGLATLPSAVDTIRAYAFGPDAGLNPANRDFVVVADFDDEAGYLTYRDHPAHRDLVNRLVTPIVAERAGIQFGC